MTNNLRPGERLDDLQLGGLELIQNPSKFCFGVDAVFLSDWQDAVLHITIWKTELAL